MILIPEPLTAAAFAPFGDVIEVGDERTHYAINYGRTERYHDLAQLDVLENEGKPTVSIFRSQPAQFPLKVEVMERHPHSSQAFLSMQRKPFLVLVAPPGEQPLLEQLRLFVVGADQGVNYHRGVWHHYQFSLDEVRDFLCIDRSGGYGGNCDEYRFVEAVYIPPIPNPSPARGEGRKS